MATTAQSVADVCLAAKRASRELARLDTLTKDRALNAIADAIDARVGEILEANARDMEAATGETPALRDRMRLDAARVAGIAEGVRAIVALRDPVGEVIEGFRLPNGLDVRQVRVPLGVVAVVYEARPNVTIDCTALALKAGNAIVLRGSSQVTHSNSVLAAIAVEAATAAGVPEGAIGLVAGGGREELGELATQEGLVDLIIPRGGEGLKNALKAVATVPVIYAASGNCHVYVDSGADLHSAEAIIVNAKTQRPGVCNAAETLLVHRDAAAAFLPRALRLLREAGVELRVDARAKAAAGDLGDSLARRGGRGLGHRVPRPRARRRRHGLRRGGDRAHQRPRLRALRRDRHALGRVRPPVPRRRRLRLRLRERVHPLHRRLRVRHGRRDRQLHAEAARPRPDRHARAVHLQVRRRRLRPDQALVSSVGILGGTFNPPHVAHLVCARAAAAQLELDKVLFMPVAAPPHKALPDDPGAQARLTMCRLATAGDDRFQVSDAEVRRGGSSYTVATLEELHANRPEDELTFIAGGDMAASLPEWRDPERLLELARFAVAERAGAERDEIERRTASLKGRKRIVFFDMPRLDISSSQVRARVAAGQSIDDLVPATVAAVHRAARPLSQRGDGTMSELVGEELARVIAGYADDKKAQDIVELDLRGVVGYTDYFVICSGASERQVKAIHDGIHLGMKDDHGILPRRVEGVSESRWILMDYLDVVVHVFTPQTREYYRLEQLWGEAPARELGSASQVRSAS